MIPMNDRPFDPDVELGMEPIYSLNLTGAQRGVLEWLDAHGACFVQLAVDVKTVAEDCGLSEVTVRQALQRLVVLRLVQHPSAAVYRVNPRYYFWAHPEIRRLVGEALDAPDIAQDARVGQPRKETAAKRRRRAMHAVPDPGK